MTWFGKNVHFQNLMIKFEKKRKLNLNRNSNTCLNDRSFTEDKLKGPFE